MKIPVIKVRDKQTGVVRIVGERPYDCLTVDEHGINYYNLQNSEGTGPDGDYEFVAVYEDHFPMIPLEEEINGMVLVEKRRLEALERVAEEAKEVAHTPPSSEDPGRNWAYWEFWKRDMDPLIEAVKALEEIEALAESNDRERKELIRRIAEQVMKRNDEAMRRLARRDDKRMERRTVEFNKARLEELSLLKDGWYNGSGKALNPSKLEKFADSFSLYYPDDLPLPYVYPTVEGHLQLEWTLGFNEASLEVNLDNLQSEWHSVDISTREDEVATFDLSTKHGWDLLGQKLRETMTEI